MLTPEEFRAHEYRAPGDVPVTSITLNGCLLCQYTEDEDGLHVSYKDAVVMKAFWPSWFPSEAAVVGHLIVILEAK